MRNEQNTAGRTQRNKQEVGVRKMKALKRYGTTATDKQMGAIRDMMNKTWEQERAILWKTLEHRQAEICELIEAIEKTTKALEADDIDAAEKILLHVMDAPKVPA